MFKNYFFCTCTSVCVSGRVGVHVCVFAFQVYWRTPKGRQYLKREVKRKKYYFGIHRPWTTEFQMENERGTMRKKVFVEPICDWSFFKGDRVRSMCM
jgi:hypothetical protein